MRSPRLVVTALALFAALTLLFSHAAFATAAPEPSATIAPGGTANFTIAGFSLSSSRPAPASVQVATNPAAFANGPTWRNIVYYAVDWGIISSDPAQVQAALWYVSSGVWPAGDHSTAQRLVDTARSSATPASTANGYDLLFAISGGRASATASFSSGSGSVIVTNLQSMPLTVYLPYGTILVGPDNLPAYAVYAIGSGNPPAQATATRSAAQATVTQAAGLPTAQPTASGGAQPSATPPASGQPTATPKPTLTPDGAGKPATPTASPSVGNPSSAASLPTATAIAAPATGTPTATAPPADPQPQTSPPAGQPAPPVSKPAAQSASGQPHIAPAAPTPIPTAEDTLASPIPTEGSGLPTDVPTFIYPTFTPRPSLTPGGPALTAIPSATSVFPPTATSASGAASTTGNPNSAAPTKPPLAASTATLPTLPNEAPLNATPPPPGSSPLDGSGTAGGAATSGSASGSVSNPATAPSSVAPKTGEQSPLPLYLLVGGLVALVAGVVVIQLNNRRAKK